MGFRILLMGTQSVQGCDLVTFPVSSKVIVNRGLRAQLEELVAPVQPSRTLADCFPESLKAHLNIWVELISEPDFEVLSCVFPCVRVCVCV